ncbi:hypothetical protein DFH09DRAFT_1079266 [Mycena vulgaris]|nr:hypothetical protein DFH09DRAFT_1079266 [Mycena vulgaris]
MCYVPTTVSATLMPDGRAVSTHAVLPQGGRSRIEPYYPFRPTLKTRCSLLNSSINMPKIVEILTASDFLNMKPQACFIMAFDLLNRPRLDKPFAARLDLGVEPINLMDFLSIYWGGHDDGVAYCGNMPVAAAEAATASGFSVSVALLVVSKASALISTYPVVIFQDTIDWIRSKPKLKSISAITGKTTELVQYQHAHGVHEQAYSSGRQGPTITAHGNQIEIFWRQDLLTGQKLLLCRIMD